MDSFIQKTLSFVAYVTKWGALIARQDRAADFAGFGNVLADNSRQFVGGISFLSFSLTEANQ